MFLGSRAFEDSMLTEFVAPKLTTFYKDTFVGSNLKRLVIPKKLQSDDALLGFLPKDCVVEYV